MVDMILPLCSFRDANTNICLLHLGVCFKIDEHVCQSMLGKTNVLAYLIN